MELKDIIHNGKSEKEIEILLRNLFEEEYDEKLQFIFLMHKSYTREEREDYPLLRAVDSFLYDD